MPKIEHVTALRIDTTTPALVIVFDDREVRISWEKCSAKLAAGNEAQRQNAELSPGGYGIHWPLLDEDLSIAGLLRSASH